MKTQLRLFALALAACLVSAAPAAAAVSVGHSGWSWGNPLPQGNDIKSLEFGGGHGYAAGKFGTLLRTDDAGNTWTGVVTGITADLARVRIIDADSLVIAGACALRRSDDAGQTFTRLPWTASDLNCPQPIVSLAFPTEQVGYVVIANGGVFRTADGGRTWARKTAVPGTSSGPAFPPPPVSGDVFFTGPDTGVALSGGQIYRTIDGAGSWTLVATHSQRLNGLFFVDGTTGYAVGGASSVLKTVNGGASWDVKSTGGALNLTSIRCADALTCLVTAEDGKQLLRTVNGADSFSSVTPSTDRIFAAAFASGARAVAAGVSGSTVASNDGGATWAALGGRLPGEYTRLRATSPSLAFAIGTDGALARTADGGNSWTSLGVSTSGDVRDASFLSPTVGYALDSTGAVLKTDNGGTSWQFLNTGTTATPGALLARDANTVLLFGPRGVRRSTNGGGEFSSVKGKAVRRARVSDYDRAGSSLFAYGDKVLIVSTNGGKSWKKVKAPTSRRADLLSVDFVSAKHGFAVTDDDRVWETRNRGKRWSRLWGAGSGTRFTVSFSGTRTGWIAQDGFGDYNGVGFVLRTSDGGKTWRPQLLDDDQLLRQGLVATGQNTGLALLNSDPLLHFGSGSNLLTTATGGDTGAASTLKLKTKKRTLRRRTTIKVSGKLTPAEGGERVQVSALTVGGSRSQDVTVASNGTFTTSWKVKRTSYYVAQWFGDDDHAGDGSNVLTVKLGRRRR